MTGFELDEDKVRAINEGRSYLEDVPALGGEWDVPVRGAAKLAVTLHDQLDLALLFRRIATLELDAPTFDIVEDLRWRGPTAELAVVAARIDAPELVARAKRIASSRR